MIKFLQFAPFKSAATILLSVNLIFLQYTFAGSNHTLLPDTLNDQVIPEWRPSPDDPIVATLDSLALLTIFKNVEKTTSRATPSDFFPYGHIPQYIDSVYLTRFEELNRYTTIELVYNSYVKSYVSLYAERRRELTEKVMGLSELYFPVFEEKLDQYNLPLELKYVSIIESALNPLARSRVGATGLWQFMYGTGKMYGLDVNTMVDERSDVHLSTDAACRHFADLYQIYEDWFLVLAAYNAGPGNVNRAIRRAGGVKDFWLIRNYLPRETRNYVPAFIAVTYVMEYAKEHNLFPTPPLYTNLDIDTLHVKKEISLRTVSKFIDIPLDHLRYLNPTFKQNIIPYNPKNEYYLRIPRSHTGVFMANQDTILNYKSPEELRLEERKAMLSETTVHVVRRGENLGLIARRYGTSVRTIQRLNNMRGSLIRPGQRLVVRAPAHPPVKIDKDENVHIVKKGETIGILSGRYRVSQTQLRDWNNLSDNNIYAGQKLIVRKKDENNGDEDQENVQMVTLISSGNKVVSPGENLKDAAQITENRNGSSQPLTNVDTRQDPNESLDNELTPYVLYIVQENENLTNIASRFHQLTVEMLKEVNDFSGDTSLEPGQKIMIPLLY